MAKKFSPKFKAAALKLLDAGVSTREAQSQLAKRFKGEHVGEGTLRRWAAMVWAEQTADVAPPPNEPVVLHAPPVEAPLPNGDVYEHTRQQLADAMRRADEAARDGNHTAAQRFSGDVVKYTLLLARLDKERKSDTDTVTFTRAELDAKRKAMVERVTALADDLLRTGGIVCSHCGRELRIALARGE